MNVLIACISYQLIRLCTGDFCFIFSDVELKNKAWQVVELEESRNNVLQENQQLLENVSSLQFQIKDLHSIASTQSSDEFTKVSILNLLIRSSNIAVLALCIF